MNSKMKDEAFSRGFDVHIFLQDSIAEIEEKYSSCTNNKFDFLAKHPFYEMKTEINEIELLTN